MLKVIKELAEIMVEGILGLLCVGVFANLFLGLVKLSQILWGL